MNAEVMRALIAEAQARANAEREAAQFTLDAQLIEVEHRGYLRGRSEQRAADVAALRDVGSWLLAADHLESLPVLGGEGPETP